MIRNLKALGLALVAVFAMSAVVASAAQAEAADFAAAEYPATIDATGETNQLFKVAGLPELTCVGTGAGVASVHGQATQNAASATLTAENITYTTCHVVLLGITFPVTVDFNSCDYKFSAGTKTATGSAGSVAIECSTEGDEVTVTVFDNSEHKTDRCVVHVPEQAVGGTITYTNIETTGGLKAVTVKAQNAEVEATVTDTNKLGCNNHVTDPEAKYNGTFVAEATNEAKELINSEVT